MFTLRTLTVVGMVLALTVSAQAQGKKGPSGKNHARAKQAPYAENDIITQAKQTKSGSLAPKIAPKSAPVPKVGEPKASSNGPTLVPVSVPKLFKNANGAVPGTPSSKAPSGTSSVIIGQDQETGEIIYAVKGRLQK